MPAVDCEGGGFLDAQSALPIVSEDETAPIMASHKQGQARDVTTTPVRSLKPHRHAPSATWVAAATAGYSSTFRFIDSVRRYGTGGARGGV